MASIWLPTDVGSVGSSGLFPRTVSPPPSRGNSLGGDFLSPGLQPPMYATQMGGSLRPRSLSPRATMSALTMATQMAANSSVASSIEVPTTGMPMAMVGVDTTGNGRAKFLYVGADSNRDGVPDRLQGSSLPPAAAAAASMPLMATSSALAPEAYKESSLKLQDAQVWFNGQRAPLSTLVQDTVTKQFLQMKESMNQEVQRCVQMLTTKAQRMSDCEDLLQRLEAERGGRESTLASLRHDFDRQQSQITEVVQSRLCTSAVQDRALRERDEDLAGIIDTMRRDMEVIRTQNRNALSGNVVTTDQQQRVEKACLELRRDLEGITAENHRHRNVQVKMRKEMEETRKRLEQGNPVEKTSLVQGQQLTDLFQQLATQREYQQQVERVLLELRKDLQGTTSELEGATLGLKLQKDRATEQQKTIQEHEKKIDELRRIIASQGSAAQIAGDAALNDLRRQVESSLTVKREQQLLSASFGADLEQRVGNLEENIIKSTALSEHIRRDSEVTAQNIQDLAKTVKSENGARIDMAQAIELYRSSYLQTASELRDNLILVQERFTMFECVQLEDRTLRERTMEAMEVNIQELMSVTQLERDARLQSAQDSARRVEEMAELKRKLQVECSSRVDLTQSLENLRSGYEQTSSDTRKEIEVVSENCTAVRGVMDHYIQDLTRMVQEESDARCDFCRVFDLHRARSEEVFNRIGRIEGQQTESTELLAGIMAEETGREALRVEYISTTTELRAELDLAMEKLERLESMCEESETRQGRSEESGSKQSRAITELQKSISDVAKNLMEGVGSETAVLRCGMESMNSSLQSAVVDLEVERHRRAQESSGLQNEVQALRSQLSQMETQAIERESKIDVKSAVVQVTEPVFESLKESVSQNLSVVSADVQAQKVAMAKDSSQIQTGMRVMQAKLLGLETAASEDRGWRQQAVQDLEGILGEIKHITPTAASTRTLPTLASALRLCKAEQA